MVEQFWATSGTCKTLVAVLYMVHVTSLFSVRSVMVKAHVEITVLSPMVLSSPGSKPMVVDVNT